MRALSAAEWLSVWEKGSRQPPAERALTLLAASRPEAEAEELARLPVGRRNAELMALQERAFGPKLDCLTTCPSCGERLELTFGIDEVRAALQPQTERDKVHGPSRAEALDLAIDDWALSFRLPTSLDLTVVSEIEEAEEARRKLLERCMISARRKGEEVGPDSLPAEIGEAIERQMARADPLGDVDLSLCCSACKHEWLASFDIAGYLWAGIDVWARRIMYEVHRLASAYGWRETDILSMSPWRRHQYITMATG